MKFVRAALFTLVSLLLLGGCNGCSSTDSVTGHASINERFRLMVGEVPVNVQVAITGPEQTKGLMFCESLTDGDGMLFYYKDMERRSFWMNNVPIALSIGFFDADGVLLEVRRMLPRDTTSILSSSDRVRFALEMNDGWYERHGVRPGAKLDLDLVREAVIARGHRRLWR
jgi:uncharacterized membrane protein (UPF0127 family)